MHFVKSGGTVASVVGEPANAGRFPDVQVKTMQVTPDPVGLVQLAKAVQSGALTIPLGARFSLRDMPEAHRVAEKGSSGKVLVTV